MNAVANKTDVRVWPTHGDGADLSSEEIYVNPAIRRILVRDVLLSLAAAEGERQASVGKPSKR
jgi:hypothetical protein